MMDASQRARGTARRGLSPIHQTSLQIFCADDPAAALALAQKLQAERPLFSGVHYTLAMALIKTGEWDEAERLLRLADNEASFEWLVNVGMVELCLARPNPTPQMFQVAENFAKNLAYEGEPCRSKALEARLAFAQGRPRDAATLNRAALQLATEAERPELERRQAEYETAEENR